MLREIVFDTETTGTDPAAGDRVVEIGCIELLNHIPTGRSFHRYVNPQRAVQEGAFAVHGLSDSFLAGQLPFAAIADEFAEFVEGGRLIAHNAAFDIAFLNAEFARIGRRPIPMADVVDTLALARRKHPGAPNNLDALCARYGVDNTRRTKHGALLDAEILAEVYIELIGGKQADLGLGAIRRPLPLPGWSSPGATARPTSLRVFSSRLSDGERQAHLAFLATLGPGAIWRDYIAET